MRKFRTGWVDRDAERRRSLAAASRPQSNSIVLGRRGLATSTKSQLGNLNDQRYRAKISPDLLDAAYVSSPYIRPCIDGITRTIRGTAWDVISDEGEMKGTQARARDEIVGLLKDPNKNKGAWPGFIAAIAHDLLIHDAAAIEKTYGIGSGRVTELVPLYGPSIKVIQDEHANLEGFEQVMGLADPVKFKPEDLIYLAMYASTRSPYGSSIIQTCADHISVLLLAIDHHARSMSRDEIPDGIVFASGISQEEWKKIKTEAKQNVGYRDKLLALISEDPDAKFEWTQFTRLSRDMQLIEVEQMAERIIVRNFGLDMTTAGVEQKFGTRSRGQIETAATQSTLIKPICSYIAENINNCIVNGWPNAEGLYFKFYHEEAVDRLAEAKIRSTYIQNGFETINEARIAIGRDRYEDVELADRPMLVTSGGILLLDSGQFLTPDLKKQDDNALAFAAAPSRKRLVDHDHGEGCDCEYHKGVDDASVAYKVAATKGHANSLKLEEVIRRYHGELAGAFDNFGREAIAVVTSGLPGRETLQISRVERDQKVDALRRLKSKYVGIWQSILPKYADEAAKLGADRALLVLKLSQLSDEDRAATLKEYVQKNQEFMVDSWRRYLDKVIWVLNRLTKGMASGARKGPGGLDDDAQFSTLPELIGAEEAALAACAASAEAYSKYLWALENVIYAREAGAAGLKVFWHQTSINPCGDCENAGNHVYDYLDLPFYPGAGTQCDGRCYCFLEIVSEREAGQLQ